MRRASWASATRSSSTTTSRSGARSRTTTGRPSTSSMATGACSSTTSARRPTRRPSERSSGCWASTVSPSASTPAASPRPPTGTRLRSPETYVGYARGERRTEDARALNDWALTGDWSVGEEAAVLEAAAGSIAYRFQARDLNLVLTPADAGAPVRFAVRLDGQPPGDAHGLDVDASGEGIVSEPRMYQLVRQRGAVARAHVRDHVPRPRRARVRLHLRLISRARRDACARTPRAGRRIRTRRRGSRRGGSGTRRLLTEQLPGGRAPR